MPVATGSDTRMYNPRSESNLGYTKDEDENPYGIGDPETMEQYKDKKQAEKESETLTADLPHLQLSVPEPEPEMPPMMPEEEEPVMDDDNENAVGAEISQMTGMPDTGNLSIGNAIGTMPQPGGTLMTGEPMEDAWSTLLKLEDPAAEGRPHSSFDLMNTSRPPEGVTEEDLAAFYQANPDIYHPSSAWTQGRDEQGKPTGVAERPPLMRFPAYRKPVALGEELIHAEHYPVSVGSEGRYAHSPADYDKIRRETGEHRFSNRYHHFPALQTRHEVLGTPGGTYNVETGEPMNDAWSSLMKAKYLDENLSNVLYGQQDPVAEPVSEEPPHPASIEGDAETRAMRNELDRLRQEHVTLMLNPQLAFSRGIQPHVQQDKIRELERELEDRQKRGTTVWYDKGDNFVVGPFPTAVWAYKEGDRRGDIVEPQEENEEARANTPDLVRWGEPIDDAWSSLMKARLDKVKGAKDKSWKQPLYEIQPGGAEIKTANPRRAKLQSRYVQPHKKRGLDVSPLSVHRTHLGISTKQPLKLFPQQYGHQMATQARRKLMGNIPQAPAAHGFGPETSYNPRSPKVAASQGLSIKEPREPTMRGASFAKSDELNLVKKDLEEVRKKMDYMHFAQIRRLLRRLKDATERQERRLKAAESSGKGNNREAGHREAMDSTTRPEGGTEDLENDPKNWGAPSTIFAARGSGRVG